jgi:hypothetical protein
MDVYTGPAEPPTSIRRYREKIKKPGVRVTEVASKAGAQWRAMSPQEKEPYKKTAALNRDKYKLPMTEYRTSKPPVAGLRQNVCASNVIYETFNFVKNCEMMKKGRRLSNWQFRIMYKNTCARFSFILLLG